MQYSSEILIAEQISRNGTNAEVRPLCRTPRPNSRVTHPAQGQPPAKIMSTEPPQATLRQRAVTTTATESPPSTTPPSPPTRPTLSRQSTGTFDLANANDEAFSLPLLDLLVIIDSHLELWTRSLRQKAAPWKSKADKLVEESKQRAQTKIGEARAKLPRVSSEQFLNSMLEDSGVRDVLSPKDREKLERRYREVRQKTLDNMKKLSLKWEEE